MRIDVTKVEKREDIKNDDIIILDAREVSYSYRFYFGIVNITMLNFFIYGLSFDGKDSTSMINVREASFGNSVFSDLKSGRINIYKLVNKDIYSIIYKNYKKITVNSLMDILNII